MGASRRRSPGEDKQRTESAKAFVALVACVLGLLLALGGLLAVFIGGDVTASNVSAGAVGVGLGILGYYLGARRLGTVTIIFSILVLFFGVAASQGLIPGFEDYDRSLPDQEPGSQG